MLFNFSTGLFLDLYELTMAQVYFERELFGKAVFSLFIRSRPKNRPFFLFAGLDPFLKLLKNFRFEEKDLEYLESLKLFSPSFLDYLKSFSFKGFIRAIPEGTIFFENEPICEVESDLISAQIIETLIINTLHIETLIATKALLCVKEAKDIPIYDFSARRTHGICSSLHVARASYIAGFSGTSNVLAGKLWGIPVVGTMAHSFVEVFPSEEEAFKAFSQTYTDRAILLIDTYDTLKAAKKIVKLKSFFKENKISLKGVRIDSGDLVELSKKVRKILDSAGLKDVQIFLSGSLDEKEIKKLLKRKTPVSGFGVGTKMGVSEDAPYFEMGYKLVEYEGNPRFKLSPKKELLPGSKNLYRVWDEKDKFLFDLIALRDEPVDLSSYPKSTNLLIPVFEKDKILYHESLEIIRSKVKEELKRNYKKRIKVSKSIKNLYKRLKREILQF
ncbi:MAG: nicotinate phosphoribosyltransferase [Thermodesulfobacterium geofontis]|uniref:Nicotinate phosphoribosyltransferase n=1 Tax=Thermodesulfobacterium geofontis TaxID=1295609 RepID=A0A2N7QD14_9BACT|nr:MAG: nicotinate phosphoribosyltransferase [Thermodesulfobacterium geofontis]PMP96404.1 MAG: nicotinate phosphoribosyltransferase [Thermodesulfobacterium geofontis]